MTREEQFRVELERAGYQILSQADGAPAIVCPLDALRRIIKATTVPLSWESPRQGMYIVTPVKEEVI